MTVFIKKDLSALDKATRQQEVQGAQEIYDRLIKSTKMTQAQAYSLAMRILTELVWEMDEPYKTAVVNNLTDSIRGGLEIRKMQEMYDNETNDLT